MLSAFWEQLEPHLARPFLWLAREGKFWPSGIRSWMRDCDEALWLRSQRALMEQLVQGGMERREVFLLMKMHRHAEKRGGSINAESWGAERDALSEMLDGICEGLEDEYGR
jgi:hypothetical protein